MIVLGKRLEPVKNFAYNMTVLAFFAPSDDTPAMDLRRTDTILDDLEQMIVTGTFADGERLDENRLAERFGVSRTPIREALQKLATSGLVEQIPRRGVFVREPGLADLVEMFEAMAELEATCGRLAALRITEPTLDLLRATNASCQEAVEADEADHYYHQNERFHQLIYAAAANSYLEEQTLKLQKRLKPFRRMQLQLRGRLAQSMAEHVAIVDALSNGDSEGAASALRAHVSVQGEKFHYLRNHLKSRP